MSENNQSIDERIKEAQDLINIHHDYEKAEKLGKKASTKKII